MRKRKEKMKQKQKGGKEQGIWRGPTDIFAAVNRDALPIKPLVHVARTRPFDGHENTPRGIIACSSRGPPMHMPGPRSLCMYVYVFT